MASIEQLRKAIAFESMDKKLPADQFVEQMLIHAKRTRTNLKKRKALTASFSVAGLLAYCDNVERLAKLAKSRGKRRVQV